MRLRACMAFGLFVAVMGTEAAVAQGLRLQLFLPPNISSDKVDVQYVLDGRFGGYGSYVTSKSGLAFIDIPLSVDGMPASEIKMFAWAPGCQIETFDLPLNALDVHQTYACTPQPTVRLNGRIADFKLNTTKPAEVRIDYLADWACNFFGEMDCLVPQISIGKSAVEPDGSFEIEVPDFASGATELPDFTGDAAPLGGPSSFAITLREIRTGNIIAYLDPQLSQGGELKPASSYPEPTVFVVRKKN